MADIRILIEEDLKKDAERVLSSLDITTSQAIRMFLKQVVKLNGLPFNPYPEVSKKVMVKKVKKNKEKVVVNNNDEEIK